jgi:hypothetical protein
LPEAEVFTEEYITKRETLLLLLQRRRGGRGWMSSGVCVLCDQRRVGDKFEYGK